VSIGSNPLQLSVEADNAAISEEWKKALELDVQGFTRFYTFARHGDFWAFGNDHSESGDKRVTIMIDNESVSITESSSSASQKEYFGLQVWISS